jgi:hypothetical protein
MPFDGCTVFNEKGSNRWNTEQNQKSRLPVVEVEGWKRYQPRYCMKKVEGKNERKRKNEIRQRKIV